MSLARTATARVRISRLLALAIAGVLLAAGVAVAGGRAVGAVDSLPQAAYVATNPGAAAQSTAAGRTISDLEVFGGRIVAGYGDYDANTGPIELSGLDPATGAFEPYMSVPSEAVTRLRQIAGHLYAPSTDPRPGADADLAASDPWRNIASVGATHGFDVASLTGSDLWMVGSQGNDAVAWRSLDGGSSWAEALRVPPLSADGFARFYFAGVLDGRLYVQAVDAPGGARATSLVFDGVSWADGPTLFPDGGWGRSFESFAGGLIYHTGESPGLYPVNVFDGTSARPVKLAYDVTVNSGVAYALGEGEVLASSDGATWTPVASVPSSARSLAVDGGTAWLGTADGEIWSSPLAPLAPVVTATTGVGATTDTTVAATPETTTTTVSASHGKAATKPEKKAHPTKTR